MRGSVGDGDVRSSSKAERDDAATGSSELRTYLPAAAAADPSASLSLIGLGRGLAALGRSGARLKRRAAGKLSSTR